MDRQIDVSGVVSAIAESALARERVWRSRATTRTLVGAAAMVLPLLSANTRGEIVSGGTVSAGQSQDVTLGTVAVSTRILGTQNIESGGIVTIGSVLSGGTQNVNNGGSARLTSVASGGVQNINAGGVASGTTVLSGGLQAVNSGGIELSAIISNGAIQNVNSGGTVHSTRVLVAVQNVNGGGSAIGGTITSGGTQNVGADGLAIGPFISSGGVQNVNSGGTAISAVVSVAVQNVNGGGSSIATTISSGGIQNVSASGFASGDVILQGGTQNVSAGGTAVAVDNGGGVQNVGSGAVVSGGVIAGGLQNVSSGGTAIGVTGVFGAGVQSVAAGANVSNTTLFNGGTQLVAAGASVFDTTIYGAGTLADTIKFGGGSQSIASGGTVIDTHLLSGGIQAVTLGATVIHTDINDTTEQIVSSGGLAMSAIVNSGGIELINAGAGVSGTTINTGGIAVANETGVSLANLMLNGGTLWLNNPNAGDVEPARFHQVSVNGLSGVGVAGFATNVARQTGDLLNVQNGQGTLSMAVHDYSTTAADPTFRLLVVATDPGTTTQVSLQGRSVDIGAFQYGLLKDGPNYYLAVLRAPDDPVTPGSGGGSSSGGGITPGGGGGSSIGAGSAVGGDVEDGIGGTDGFLPTNTTQTVVAAAKAVGAIWYSQLQQVQKRLGDLRSSPVDNGVWVRTYGDERRLFNPGVNITGGGAQAGIDHRYRTDNGDWIAGFTTGVGYDSLDMGSSGTGNTNQWNVGLYGLWLGNAGWYAGATAKYNYIDVRLHSMTGEGEPVSAAYNLTGYTLSLEGGKRWLLKDNWFVEPQVEWTMAHGGSASYTTSTDLPVNTEAATSQLVRVGISFGKRFEKDNGDSVEPYMRVSAVRQFHGDNAVIVAGSPFDVTMRTTYGVVSVGTTAKFKNLQFFAEVGYARGTGYEMPWSLNAGLRYSW